MTAPLRVPLSEPDFGVEEEQAVLRVLRSRWLTLGPETEAFEREFAAYLGAREVIGVSNGTAALHLALLVTGIQPGDEVIVPSLTFVATANAVRYCGAKPVFADVRSLDDWTIAPDNIRKKLTERTKAIIVMHYGGFACRMDDILAIARERNLVVIEDAAHAPGAFFGDRKLGTLGALSCFSFFSNKNMAVGEGGAISTDDENFEAKLRLLRSHGMSSLTAERHQGRSMIYDVTVLGFNYRIDELHAALARTQLAKLDAGNRRRHQAAARYRGLLANLSSVHLPFSQHPHKTNDHLFPMMLRDGAKRDQCRQYLRERGVQTSMHYPPIHTFTDFRASHAGVLLPVTEQIGRSVVTLPMFAGISDAQVDLVCTTIQNFLQA